MDVVGYSAESTDLQFDVVMDLNREVQYVLYAEFNSDRSTVIALPTGDGMLLALLDDDGPRPGLAERCLELLVSLRSWTDRTQKVTLRYGVHYGAISFVRDINGNRNICGDAANVTARLMSLGQANHIVASETFINRFFPQCGQKLGQWVPYNHWRLQAIEEVDTRVKHQRRILGYSLLISRDQDQAGSAEELDIKYHADVRFPAISKAESRKRTFARVLADAERLTLLGLYYGNLASVLPGDKCESLTVCVPSESLYEDVAAFFGIPTRPTSHSDIMDVLRNWRDAHPEATVTLLEYSQLPPFGASLAERSTGARGFLHVSHYLRGIPPESTPYIELSWHYTLEAPPLYAFYADYIHARLVPSFTRVTLL